MQPANIRAARTSANTHVCRSAVRHQTQTQTEPTRTRRPSAARVIRGRSRWYCFVRARRKIHRASSVARARARRHASAFLARARDVARRARIAIARQESAQYRRWVVRVANVPPQCRHVPVRGQSAFPTTHLVDRPFRRDAIPPRYADTDSPAAAACFATHAYVARSTFSDRCTTGPRDRRRGIGAPARRMRSRTIAARVVLARLASRVSVSFAGPVSRTPTCLYAAIV